MPDYLRPKSAAVKRAFGAAYIIVGLLLGYVSWSIIGTGFDRSFGLDGNQLAGTSNLEVRLSVLLMALPGILIAIFLLLGLRMLITGRVSGEQHLRSTEPAEDLR